MLSDDESKYGWGVTNMINSSSAGENTDYIRVSTRVLNFLPRNPYFSGQSGLCVLLSKPVEKIMIRYDIMPDDILGFTFFLGRAVSPILIPGSHKRLQRHKTRNANAFPLTISKVTF